MGEDGDISRELWPANSYGHISPLATPVQIDPRTPTIVILGIVTNAIDQYPLS